MSWPKLNLSAVQYITTVHATICASYTKPSVIIILMLGQVESGLRGFAIKESLSTLTVSSIAVFVILASFVSFYSAENL